MGLQDYINPLVDRAVNTPLLPFLPQSVNLKNLFTRPPGTFTQFDPGSLYGNYKQDPKGTMMNTIMAMTTGPTSNESRILYHGTNDINAKSILDQGFKLGRSEIGPGMYRTEPVSLIDKLKTAMDFAKSTASRNGGKPVVLQVDVSKLAHDPNRWASMGKYGNEFALSAKDLPLIKILSQLINPQ